MTYYPTYLFLSQTFRESVYYLAGINSAERKRFQGPSRLSASALPRTCTWLSRVELSADELLDRASHGRKWVYIYIYIYIYIYVKWLNHAPGHDITSYYLNYVTFSLPPLAFFSFFLLFSSLANNPEQIYSVYFATQSGAAHEIISERDLVRSRDSAPS